MYFLKLNNSATVLKLETKSKCMVYKELNNINNCNQYHNYHNFTHNNLNHNNKHPIKILDLDKQVLINMIHYLKILKTFSRIKELDKRVQEIYYNKRKEQELVLRLHIN